jgi:3-oxoacyl-[acyl-carrier-protein] synthase II
LQIDDSNRERVASIVGSGAGGATSFTVEMETFIRNNYDMHKVTPFGIPMLIANAGSNMLSIDLGIAGPTYTLVSACATGADCIGHAFDLIRLGRVDAALAGASETPIMAIGVAAFDRTGAVSRQQDSPATASRPFDKKRSGFVFGEGAGVLVLESLESAQARGAHILAEMVAYSATSDAYHITAPHPDGVGARRAIQAALDDAHLNPVDIDYINAHGTSTSLNDVAETKAVKQVFGEHAYNVPISSTKSMTGHAMGGTAAIEAAFSVLALRDNVVPPTINLTDPDPECDLDYVPHQARELKLNAVMSNSFGFGGHNASLIFKRFNGKGG